MDQKVLVPVDTAVRHGIRCCRRPAIILQLQVQIAETLILSKFIPIHASDLNP